MPMWKNVFSRHNSNPVARYEVLNDDIDLESSDDIATFANARLEASVISQDESQQHSATLSTSSSDKLSNIRRLILLFSPVLSIIAIVAVVATTLSLGFYALLKIEPQPVVDLSIKAFSIPNHLVSRRQDALDQAMATRMRLRRAAVDDTISLYSSDLSDSSENSTLNQRLLSNGIPSTDEYEQRKLFYFSSKLLQDSSSLSDRKLVDGRSKRNAWCSMSTQISMASRVQLVYVARNDDNIFTKDRIETIHDIESRLILFDGYKDFCYIQSISGACNCTPINSLLTYLYPSRQSDGQWYFDGRGSEMLDIDEGIQVAFSRTPYAHWYTDGHINATYYRSTLLRSELQLGLPLQGYDDPLDRREEQMDKLEKFLGALARFLSHSSTSNVTVLYGGNEMFDYQIRQTFWNDISLASFAVAAIVLLMFILTSFSIWLTICGISSILLSFPLAFFFYRAVFKINALGILNGAAAFVIIGIGVDDVFVFINTYRQSSHIQDPVHRLTTTVKVAGKATFLTSFTTAAAFAANMFSSIPAVHDFGVFMTMIVASCWLLVVLLMPPAIHIWSCWFACCESKCYRCCWKCKLTNRLRIPQDIAHFLSCKPGHSDPAQQDRIQADERLDESADDEDLALLNLDKEEDDEEDMLLNCSDSDDPLVILEAETRAELRELSDGEGMKLSIWLQGVIYHYIALPVIRVRWIILGVYIVIFGGSIGFMTQLRPTSKPPQLFQPDTNLQMLLDLVANYSKQTLSCDDCSGVFKDSMTYAPIPPTSPRTTYNMGAASTSKTTFHQYSSSFHSTNPSSRTSKLPVTTVSSSPPWVTTTRRSTSTLAESSSGQSVTSTARRLSSTTTTSSSASSPELLRTTSTTLQTSTLPLSSTPQSTTPQLAISSSQPTSTLYFTSPVTPAVTSQTTSKEEFHPCANDKCADIPTHAPLESGIAIYVVFGIKDIDRSNISLSRVLTEKGSVIYDERFSERMGLAELNRTVLGDLCRICLTISNNSKLVKPNSAQCRPAFTSAAMRNVFLSVNTCRLVPQMYKKGDNWLTSSAELGVRDDRLLWIAFSFESTTYKGQSSFSAYKQYMEWEDFIGQIVSSLPADSPLTSMYQTSDFWNQVIMEIVAVSSAIYSLIFSVIVCVIAVTIFTGHVGLMAITMGTMLGMISLVMAVFYIVGWEIGAIEAISLSILVGSSVDYCVHIVEGYLLTASALTPQLTQQDASTIRRWRTKAAVTHIGTSVISSALTTIVAAIPLTQTILLPFSRFGTIVAINTTVAIVYSLTVCVSFLAVCAPARFTNTWKSTVIALFSMGIILSLSAAILYCIAQYGGVHIPGPNGADLFKVKGA